MTDLKTQSPIHQARKRVEEFDRRQADALAKLIPADDQGRIKDDDAKRIAAALMELMKR
ncbi:hypothetical protein [Thiocystis violacea]|uniref:hypothetical protein n=1 Tax=Thiocystis violacea TaxID=13725 RepID=UPI001908545D|nr:hypothetical protein [Thiocystis violacea]